MRRNGNELKRLDICEGWQWLGDTRGTLISSGPQEAHGDGEKRKQKDI